MLMKNYIKEFPYRLLIKLVIEKNLVTVKVLLYHFSGRKEIVQSIP